MKRHPSNCPSDNLLNEYFSEASDLRSGHIADLFNKVFDSGHIPESWSHGYIVPIYKKGDKNDPNNYRGLTLMSHFGKLFVRVINNRVM